MKHQGRSVEFRISTDIHFVPMPSVAVMSRVFRFPASRIAIRNVRSNANSFVGAKRPEPNQLLHLTVASGASPHLLAGEHRRWASNPRNRWRPLAVRGS
jgi:hypothetical protein